VEYSLGVDLGTTYTAAAVHSGGRAQIVQLGSRRAEIPSLVFLREDGVVLVGDAAERRGALEPGRLAREFKRRLGDPVPVLVGGSPISAHALMARVLEHVHQTVSRGQEGPPSRVVVTHPANWGPYKRELLLQATTLADVPGVRLRTEPQERVQPGEIVAVYDLGGGTFDAAVLRKTESGFELCGEPSGVEQLGGVDFDEAVLGHVSRALGSEVFGGELTRRDEAGTPELEAAVAQLRRDCTEAKESLSFDTEVEIPVALPGLHTRVPMTRAELEALIRPALDDTVEALGRAIRGAGVTADEISMVLLSGGSSRIPLVTQLLSAAYGRPIAVDPRPEHSIAMGAALVAGFPPPAAVAAPGPPLPKATVRAVAPSPDTTQEFTPTGSAPAPSDAGFRRRQRMALIAAIVIVLIGAIGGVALALRGHDDVRPAGITGTAR
jgi:molecular chaperone DnaK